MNDVVERLPVETARFTPVSSSVQNEYEKTLEESERLLLERSGSEQLAQQMRRSLRIRRSADQRVIRSPSARKIGAIRRRSRDSLRTSTVINGVSPNSRRLTRSQSMQNPNRTPVTALEPVLPVQDLKSALRRGKPNTVRTGLRDPTPLRSTTSAVRDKRTSLPMRCDETPHRGARNGQQEKRAVQRAVSVMKLAQNFATVRPAVVDVVVNAPAVTPENCKWTSAEMFHRQFDHLRVPLTGRPSVQKIRSENIGKVSACVRKFDGMASPVNLPSQRRTSMTATVSPTCSNNSTIDKMTTPRSDRSVRSRKTTNGGQVTGRIILLKLQ